MKDDIKSKLREELKERITSERQVVYLLVEIRKLLELRNRERKTNRQPADHSLATLEFCCDWAVHPVMDWENGKRLVRRFDQYQAFLDSQNKQETLVADLSFLKDFGDTIRLSKFEVELKTFLESEDLDPTVAVDEREWTNFLKFYTAVIEDCPLRCSDESLKHTDEVTLKVLNVHPPESGSDYQLMIEWTWVAKLTGMTTNNIQIY